MINLLPNDHKAEIRAGRTNILLIRYIFILMGAILVLGGLLIGAYIVLDTRHSSAQAVMDGNNARMAQYEPTKIQAENLRASLSNAKAILDQKVSYTKLIYKIADSIPSGVVLSTINLEPSTFGSPMTIEASARTFEDASRLRDEFANHGDVFTSVKLLSLESGSTDGGSEGSAAGYPVKVSVSVVINKGALQ